MLPSPGTQPSEQAGSPPPVPHGPQGVPVTGASWAAHLTAIRVTSPGIGDYRVFPSLLIGQRHGPGGWSQKGVNRRVSSDGTIEVLHVVLVQEDRLRGVRR